MIDGFLLIPLANALNYCFFKLKPKIEIASKESTYHLIYLSAEDEY